MIEWKQLNATTLICDTGSGRFTIRATDNKRYLLRMNSEFVASFASIEEATAEGSRRADAVIKSVKEENDWYAKAFPS